jgi:hypothetical protein
MPLRIVCVREGHFEFVLRLTQILSEDIDVEITDPKTSVCHPHAAALAFARPAAAANSLDGAAFQARHIRVGEKAVDALVGDEVIDAGDDRLLSSKAFIQGPLLHEGRFSLGRGQCKSEGEYSREESHGFFPI